MAGLVAVQPETAEKLAEALESLAKEAREGKLLGVAMLLNYPTATGHLHVGLWKQADALWAFETWKHRLVHESQDDL
jgi:hypothetical protein